MRLKRIYKQSISLLILCLFAALSLLSTGVNVKAITLTDLKGNRDNTPPTASFNAISKKKVDVIVITDYKGQKLGKLQNAITELKANNVEKFDVRTQVSSSLPRVDLGSQSGTYNKSVYGIVGRSKFSGDYDYSHAYSSGTIKYKDEPFDVCLNPIIKEPGEEPPPAMLAQVPTSVDLTTKTEWDGSRREYFDVYTFTGPIQYTPYIGNDNVQHKKNGTWFKTGSLTDTSSGSYGTTLKPRPFQFTFEPTITFFNLQTANCTNTVRAMNLSQNELMARTDSKAFYIIAIDGASTDFYSTSIYNADNSLNYMLGTLRSDNLGKYIKDSKATVLTVADEKTLDINFGSNLQTGWRQGDFTGNYDEDGRPIYKYIETWVNNATGMTFDKGTSFQDISLNQLMSQYAADSRYLDKSEADGANAVNRVQGFLEETKEKIDLVIATDKSRAEADNLSNLLKTSIGTGIDVKTTIVDGNTYAASRNIRQFINNTELKYLPSRLGYGFDYLLKVGDKKNNMWYSLGELGDNSNREETDATEVYRNVIDVGDVYSYLNLRSFESKYVLTGDGGFYLQGGNCKMAEDFSVFSPVSPPFKTNYREDWKGWRRLNFSEPIKEVIHSSNSTLAGMEDRAEPTFLFRTENDNVYALYYDYGANKFVKTPTFELLATNVNKMFSVNNALYCTDTAGNLYILESGVLRNESGGNSGIVVRNVGKIGSNSLVPVDKKGRFVLASNNCIYSGTDWFTAPNKPIVTNVKSLEWAFEWDFTYITLDNKSYTRFYEVVSEETSEDGYDISYTYDYIIRENTVFSKVNKHLAYIPFRDEKSGRKTIEQLIYGMNGRIYSSKGFKWWNGSYWEDGWEAKVEDISYLGDANANTFYGKRLSPVIAQIEQDWDVDLILLANDPATSSISKKIKLNSQIASSIYNIKSVPINSINNDLFYSTSLRNDADKILVYLSDNYDLYTELGYGNYFPWASLDENIENYFQNNKYATYFITPYAAMKAKFQYPYASSYTQQKSLLSLMCAGGVRDALRFNNTNEFISFITPKYKKEDVEDPNAIYLVQGEDKLSYKIFYDDYETDPMNALNWMFTHDPNAFENSQGLNPYSGKLLTEFIEEPMQVGKYIIQCRAQDRPTDDGRFNNYWYWGNMSNSQKVYVHRRPVADFSILLRRAGVDGFNTEISDSSYDLDRISTTNRGIVSWKWRYKQKNATEWIYGQLPGYLPKGVVYDVSLEVLDRQGAWSPPKIVTVDTNNVNLTPTVDANPTSYGWTNQNINITVTADDMGEGDFNRVEYATTDNVSQPTSFNATSYQKIFPITYTAEGIWFLHMQVWDNAGNNFYRYRGHYMIDKTPPGGTANPYFMDWTNQDIIVNFQPWDNLSGVQKWRYRTSSNSGITWGEWSGYTWGATSADITINYEGRHIIQAEVIDNAGNISYVNTGNYLIDKTAPNIAADKDGPMESLDGLTVNLSLTDNLSGVKETRYLFTRDTLRPTSGWNTSTLTTFSINQTEEGIWYLHVECEDNAGNISYKMLGWYDVILVRLFDFTVTLINDIKWRDFYFDRIKNSSDDYNAEYTRKTNTDIKTIQLPVNNLYGLRPISYNREGIAAGCKVSFSIKSRGRPDNVFFWATYYTDKGAKTQKISPIYEENELWSFEWIVPIECTVGSYINYSVEAEKKEKTYGNRYWEDTWMSQNDDRKIFYINDNVLEQLKFYQYW